MPDGRELRASVRIALTFLGVFYLFYGSAAWLSDYVGYRFNVGFEFEKQIPFVPEAAVIYLSVGPMLLLSVFILRDETRMRLLLRTLCAQTLIGFCFFLAFPVENNYAVTDGAQNLPLVFRVADLINLKNNELPSLHICFASTAAFVYSYRAKPFAAVAFHAWALSIAGAALLIHEHNLLDLAAGYMLAWWGARWWRSGIPVTEKLMLAPSEEGELP